MAPGSISLPRGSTSPTFSPSRTVRPSAMRPRTIPPTAATTGFPATEATSSPSSTMSPMDLLEENLPSAGDLRRRRAAAPPTRPGTPVFGSAAPFSMTVPSECPRLVSTTRSTSRPATNPGPKATVSGASSGHVPRFRLAILASTTTAGLRLPMHTPSGSTTTGTHGARPPPRPGDSGLPARAALASFASTFLAVTPSTVTWPANTASANATLRLTALGASDSRTTTL